VEQLNFRYPLKARDKGRTASMSWRRRRNRKTSGSYGGSKNAGTSYKGATVPGDRQLQLEGSVIKKSRSGIEKSKVRTSESVNQGKSQRPNRRKRSKGLSETPDPRGGTDGERWKDYEL